MPCLLAIVIRSFILLIILPNDSATFVWSLHLIRSRFLIIQKVCYLTAFLCHRTMIAVFSICCLCCFPLLLSITLDLQDSCFEGDLEDSILECFEDAVFRNRFERCRYQSWSWNHWIYSIWSLVLILWMLSVLRCPLRKSRLWPLTEIRLPIGEFVYSVVEFGQHQAPVLFLQLLWWGLLIGGRFFQCF